MRIPFTLLARALVVAACAGVVSAASAQTSPGERGGFRPQGPMPGGPMAMHGPMPGGPFAMGAGPIPLLRHEAVQDELELTKKQRTQVEKLVESYQADVQKQMQSSGFGPPPFSQAPNDQRSKKFEEQRKKQVKALQKVQGKCRSRLSKLLKTEQLKRLDQIGYQADGAMALRDEEVVKTLKLSKQQQQQIDDAFLAAGMQMREMFAGGPGGFGGGGPPGGRGFGGGFGGPRGGRNGNPGGRGRFPAGPGGNPQQPFRNAPGAAGQGPGGQGPGGQAPGERPAGGAFQERFEKMRKVNEERDAKVLAVLSAEQQQQFEEMKGEPFDVEQLRPRGFGPPGQGPRGEGLRDRGPGGDEPTKGPRRQRTAN